MKPKLPFTYSEFLASNSLSLEDISKEIYFQNKNSIKIKKEELAIKNLSLILKTVIKISHKKGFHAMSLRDLSKETKLSMGALYNYFSSKEEFLNMVYVQGQSLINKILIEKRQTSENSKEKLVRTVFTHLYMSEALYQIFYFFYMEAKNLSNKDQKKSINMEQFTENVFVDILEEGVTRKEFYIDDTVIMASVIKALLQDWYLKRYKYTLRKISVENYGIFIIEIIFAYLDKNQIEVQWN